MVKAGINISRLWLPMMSSITLALGGCASLISPPVTPNNSMVFCRNVMSENPALVYQQMIDCIHTGEEQRATFLYAQAGTLTWYQSLVDKKESSRIRHKTLAGEALSTLSDSDRRKFSAQVEATFDDEKTTRLMCSKLVRPTGSSAADSSNGYEDKWLLAKRGYLHCS